MAETTSYFWTDRAERAYIRLRHNGGHWRLEWGYRDPPGSDHEVQHGDRVTSAREEAVQLLLQQVRTLSGEPGELERVEQHLREALRTEEA